MATGNKFQNLALAIGQGKHIWGTDILKLYLTNTTPDAINHSVKADVPEIAGGNGYPAGGSSIAATWTRAGWVSSLKGSTVVFTASGGDVGPFRYIVLYNDTSALDELICFWDYGEQITLHDGESLTLSLTASGEILTLT